MQTLEAILTPKERHVRPEPYGGASSYDTDHDNGTTLNNATKIYAGNITGQDGDHHKEGYVHVVTSNFAFPSIYGRLYRRIPNNATTAYSNEAPVNAKENWIIKIGTNSDSFSTVAINTKWWGGRMYITPEGKNDFLNTDPVLHMGDLSGNCLVTTTPADVSSELTVPSSGTFYEMKLGNDVNISHGRTFNAENLKIFFGEMTGSVVQSYHIPREKGIIIHKNEDQKIITSYGQNVCQSNDEVQIVCTKLG